MLISDPVAIAPGTDFVQVQHLTFEASPIKKSEVQLQPKLKLPRIECGRGTAVVATVARALIERANVVDKW